MERYGANMPAHGATAAAAARRRPPAVEWPTWLAAAVCYAAWGTLTWHWQALPLAVFVPLAAYCVALQSSLRHEALHGHPTRSRTLNEALVFPPLCLLIPYRRFRDTHLRHHFDARLTDPYDDPESWFLAARDHAALPRPTRALLAVNATLAGRLVLGPWLAVAGMARHDARALVRGDRRVATAWAMHAAGAAPVVAWLELVCGLPVWTYLLAASWPGLSLLMLRTYAEHQPHRDVPQRTAIVETWPAVGFLFLNNNLHYVHHRCPRVPWYLLPRVYRAERSRFRAENGGYGYDGYLALLRRHLFRAKEPVAHPFLRR